MHSSAREIELGRPSMTTDVALVLEIERRVLWLSMRIIDFANRERKTRVAPAGREAEFHVKVGGHQASSASMVSIMTSLWFAHLTSDDKVAVKPHASPVYHAIKYLTGELDRSYLTRLRDFGGLQAYPSRTKDPDVRDFSTGSVGLGATATLFAAAARRYVDAHFGSRTPTRPRFISLVGDAELDEGNVWEAVADPALQGLGNVMWVIDVNRQSLDRVIPDMKVRTLRRLFEDSGWHVVEAKYGKTLLSAFERPGGPALRTLLDEMSNEQYQSLFSLRGTELRKALSGADHVGASELLETVPDAELALLVQNLGGHDHEVLREAYRACDAETRRPSVVFAYTVKGWGLPMAGDPLNHSALLTGEQVDALRSAVGLTPEDEWERFRSGTAVAELCERVGEAVNNAPEQPRPRLAIPESTNVLTTKPVSTQETFGRILTAFASDRELATRLVTTSPDVSISTSLGGWINKMGVFHPDEQPDFLGDGRLLRWRQSAAGQHIELGISEMNLFLLLHALGLSHELHGEVLLPVGTVYDPFVCRGLDALVYGLYNGARFVVAGTPSGVTLAPEGGAHQSSVTASIGMELPGITLLEPAYARALDWLLCDALQQLCEPMGSSAYFRLSTRTVNQKPFVDAATRYGDDDQLRRDVLAGGYRLVEPDAPPEVVLASCGAVMPELVATAEILEAEGVPAVVLDITSADRLYQGWRSMVQSAARTASPAGARHHLGRLLPPHERQLPIVTVQDAASHSLAWLGSVFGARVVPVGVDEFGQSGSIAELYEHFDLLPEQLVNAALVAVGMPWGVQGVRATAG